MAESPEEIQGEQPGSFLERFVWAILTPKRLFADIAGGAPWWQPSLWVALITMVTAYIGQPIQVQLIRLNPAGMSAEQLQQTLEGIEKIGPIPVIVSSPIPVLFTSLIVTAISYLVLSLLAEVSNFKKYFTLYMYATILLSLGVLLGTVVSRMRGVENIRTIEDSVASFGPAMLVGTDRTILHAVLNSFDIFYIWFYALIGMGVMRVFGLNGRSSILVVLPIALLWILFALMRANMPSM